MIKFFLKAKKNKDIVFVRLYECETVQDLKGVYIAKPIVVSGFVTDVDEDADIQAVEITDAEGPAKGAYRQWIPIKSISRVNETRI